MGKSNFLFALRLVLDASLPDSARALKFADIWDGCDLATNPQVEVHLDFREFDQDAALLTLFTDYRLQDDYEVARLSYVFRKRADVEGPSRSEADYEFLTFAGGDEARSIRSDLRRRVSLNLLASFEN